MSGINQIDGQKMRDIADYIGKEVAGHGFALIVFPFGSPGLSDYISNSNRRDMIKTLRETADRLEKRMPSKTPENN